MSSKPSTSGTGLSLRANVTRRRVLQAGGIAAGLVFVAPTLLSVRAKPAFASQSPGVGPKKFSARLTGGESVPSNDSIAIGVVDLTLDLTTMMIDWVGSFTSLSANSTAAHFHGPAAAGVNAGVQVPISIVPSGAPAGTLTGSAGPLTAQQAADLCDSLWYVNVHSELYPGGEIRGQLLPV